MSHLDELFRIKGKNLFDKNNRTRILGYFASSGTTWSYNASAYSNKLPCKPNTTYTARYNGNSTQAVLGFGSCSTDEEPSASTGNITVTQGVRQNSPTVNTPVTITTGANDRWLIVAYNVAEPQNTDMADNLQIEEGSTATPYSPYAGEFKTIGNIWQRAVPVTTAKAANITMKPTRTTGGDGVTYPYFTPTTVLSSLKAFGATPTKRKAAALWGQFPPVDGITNDTSTSIDTGVYAQDNIEILIRFKAITGSFYLFQARETGSSTIYGISGASSGNTINSFGIASGISRTAGHNYTVKMTMVNRVVTLYVKDETTGEEDTKTGTATASSYPFPSTTTIKLFGDASKVASGVTVYRAYIKVNGQMAWNMYPCVDVNNSNAPVAYDDVTHAASTVVSGSITAGSLIQPISFALSDGTAWAETNTKITSDDEVYLEGCVTDTGSIFLMSQGLSANNQAYQLANTADDALVFDIQTYNPYRVNTHISARNTIRKIHIKNKEIFVDGVSKGTSTGTLTNPTETAKLMYSASSSSAQKAKIVKLTVVGKCDYLPVRIGTTVELLDLVNWQFATRTGTFTAGADIPYTELCPDIIETNVGDVLYGVGKNLFDKTTVLPGYISASGVVTSDSVSVHSALIPVKKNTAYTFSGINKGGTGNKRLHAYDKDGNWLSQLNFMPNPATGQSFSVTGTTTSETAYVAISMFQADIDECQVEEGSTATPYEPYHFGLHPSGEQTVVMGEQGVVDMGTLNWGKTSAGDFTVWFVTVQEMAGGSTVHTFCAEYPWLNVTSFTQLENKTMRTYSYQDSNRIGIRDDSLSDLTSAEFKAAMSGKYLFYQRVDDASYIPPQTRTITTFLPSANSFIDIQKASNNVECDWKFYVFTGQEDFRASSAYNGSVYCLLNGGGTYAKVGAPICNGLEGASSLSNYARGKCYQETNAINLWYSDNKDTAISDTKAWLAALYAEGNPLIIAYPLATPEVTTIAIAPIELTEKATYMVTSEAMLPVEIQATVLSS